MNYKYEKNFNFKTLKYKDVITLSEIIKNTINIKITYIYISRKLKTSTFTKIDEQNFKNFEELINYLDNNNVKYLDQFRIDLVVEEDNYGSLKFDIYSDKWYLSYEKESIIYEGLISRLKKIFNINLIDVYVPKRFIIFWIIWFLNLIICIVLKLNNYFSIISNIMISIIAILNFNLKCKPYKNNKFLIKNKDSIILSIIFYILGVITPYIIELLINN